MLRLLSKIGSSRSDPAFSISDLGLGAATDAPGEVQDRFPEVGAPFLVVLYEAERAKIPRKCDGFDDAARSLTRGIEGHANVIAATEFDSEAVIEDLDNTKIMSQGRRLPSRSILADGRAAYLFRKPRRNGATHLVMTSMQFLARIAALIPPPRFPLQRLSGVFGPQRAAARGGCPARAGGESWGDADVAPRQEEEEEEEAEGEEARRSVAVRGERRGDVARARRRRQRERRAWPPANEPR